MLKSIKLKLANGTTMIFHGDECEKLGSVKEKVKSITIKETATFDEIMEILD